MDFLICLFNHFPLSLLQAGVLLEGDEEEEEKREDGDCKSNVGADIFEFIPSPTSRLLCQNFDKQLQIGEVLMTVGEPATSRADEETEACLQTTTGHAVRSSRELHTGQAGKREQNMQTDEETETEAGNTNHAGHKVETSGRGKCDDWPAATSSSKVSDSRVKQQGGSSNVSVQGARTRHRPGKRTHGEADNTKTEENQANQSSSDSDSGRPESSEEEKQGERTPSEGEIREQCGESDSGVEEYPSMLWKNLHTVVREKERERLSELSAGLCAMDSKTIV